MKTTNNHLALLPAYAGPMLAQLGKAETLLAGMSDAEKQAAKESNADWLDISKDAIRGYLGLHFNQRQPMRVLENGIAVIHVHGFLAPGLTFIESCLEATDYADIMADIRAAEENPLVKAVRFWISSPGGACIGCLEVATAIVGMKKPTGAYVDGICGSAAYFIASACGTIYAQASDMVGSIGTIYTVVEYGAYLRANGVGAHIITSPGADQKAAGNMLREPTKEEMESINAMVSEYGDQFVSFVLSRRAIPEAVLRGNAVSGRQAVGFNLIDGLATKAEVDAELLELAA